MMIMKRSVRRSKEAEAVVNFVKSVGFLLTGNKNMNLTLTETPDQIYVEIFPKDDEISPMIGPGGITSKSMRTIAFLAKKNIGKKIMIFVEGKKIGA